MKQLENITPVDEIRASAKGLKKTWYQLNGSKLAEFWTILHLPYTLMNLSFLAIGFGIAGIHRWDVFVGAVIAYLLGLTAAHAVDQLPGQGSVYVEHLRVPELLAIAIICAITAVFLGIFWMVWFGAWQMLWIIPLQGFFVVAYPYSKFAKGFFHSDLWFAVSFGFIPVMVGYYANTLTITAEFVPWAVVAAIISLMEITLSRYVRALRKGGDKYLLPLNELLFKPERALILLCLLSYCLAAILIIK